MSSSQDPHNLDLESAETGRSGEPNGSGENEAVQVEENNCGDGKDKNGRRETEVSECTVEIVDLESGARDETKLNLGKSDRDCRICHLSLDSSSNQDPGQLSIELGCSCKNELGAAHKQCAEAWFKIRGNKTCEICGSVAQNVVGITEAELMEHENEPVAPTVAATALSESRTFWRGHRFLNFLLACMVFAFVISWLFHFNVPS